MKKILFSTLLMLCCFLVSAQSQLKYARVTENYYIGKYEISNAEYKKYLNYLVQTKQSMLYTHSLPDTTLWKRSNEPYEAFYFSYEAYSSYPLVGITYDNAVEYCKWLTDQYNSNRTREFKKVLFRLPTEKEWTYAANGGDNKMVYAWDSPYLLDKSKGYMCNFLRLGDNFITYDDSIKYYKIRVPDDSTFIPKDRMAIPRPVRNYTPNQFGLYNMCGNVAEMVQEKGIAKGGSYNDPGYDVRIESIKKYTSPSTEIGFRIAMEILEK